jgi:two-component system, NtrC family, sensor kinase
MRLVTRLTVGFLIVVICTITLHEYLQLDEAQRDFEEDLDRSHLLVATTLADAVEQVAPHEGFEGALKMVEATDQRRSDLRIRWVCVPGRVDSPPPPRACNSLEVPTPITTSELTRRFTLAPVRVDGESMGAIEVSESPDHEFQWARAHFNQAAVLALMTIVGMTIAAFVLGVWLVARPTRALMDKARAVGRGELKPDLHLPSHDELSLVGDEMNAMCAQLGNAQDQAARSAAARLAAVEQLRHADRLATVGRLASGLAHELGTPLNVIEARAGLILEDPSVEPHVQNSARVIINCTEQVTTLVRQLLVFARPRTVELAPFSLDGLAHSVVELLEPLAAQRKVKLSADQLAPVTARADAVLLQQAVMNVVVNALHACAAGGHVTLSTGHVTAPRPDSNVPQAWSTLSVSDDGIGMTPEVKASIFEPFFTTRAAGEGTGLGLPIVASILEDHHGFLSVQTAPGKGSTFTLHLPETDGVTKPAARG